MNRIRYKKQMRRHKLSKKFRWTIINRIVKDWADEEYRRYMDQLYEPNVLLERLKSMK